MKRLWLTTAGELADALEKAIKEGRDPKTPEDWERFMAELAQTNACQHVGDVPDNMTPGYIAGSLRDEGINARVMKQERKDA